ncbi:MAG TPA: aldo/keto reductase [Bryobacterales bacterium]|nr:aldo/keto reductase [Bryobacterales bacterium]
MTALRPLGATGLECHPLGFGCYRVADGNAVQADALAAYLDRGGNLIDTSANYMDGDSETLVGRTLQNRPRGGVIIVTKGGYIQGRNLALAQQRNFPEVVKYADGLWHSIHPEFLETQVQLSSERLQTDCIDVYLLHNPEYYLEDIARHRPLTAADHDEFYRRVGEALRFLESQVAKGRIRWYGVSSNNYALAEAAPAHTSVARTLAAAEAVSANHHFRVVQLPLNLYESGGALERNNGGKTVLEFCREKGIGVLANRPLNAYHGGCLVRLADFRAPGSKPPDRDDLRRMLRPLAEHEQKLALDVGGELMGPGIANSLLEIVPQLRSLAHWEQTAGPYVIRPIQEWLQQSRKNLSGRPGWEAWQNQFIPLINAAFDNVQRYLSASQQESSDAVRVQLAQAGYPPSGESLSRLALNVLLGLDGLSAVLAGMRRAEYVEDALGAVAMERVDSREILKRLGTTDEHG